MKFKKYKNLFLLSVLMILFLSACSGNDTEAVEMGTEEIVIKWMVYGNESVDSDYVFAEFNRELQKHMPEVTVEFEVINKDDYKAEWDMKMATNTWVDIAWVGEESFAFTDEVKDGNFMAIDYLLSTNGGKILEVISDDLWIMVSRGGNTFAIPIEGAMYREELGLIVRQSYVDGYPKKNDLKKVFTGDNVYLELEDYLTYLEKMGGIGTGVSYSSLRAIPNRGLEGVYGDDSPFVIRIEDDKPTIYNKYELPEYVTYFEAMHRWYERGYIREDINEVINPEENDGRINGSAMFVQEIGEEGIRCNDYNIEYAMDIIPLCSRRYIGYETTRNCLVIPKSSKNPMRAMDVLNLIYSEDGKDLYRLLVNGFEEEHYQIREDGTIDRKLDSEGNLLYGLSQYSVGSVTSNYELTNGQFERMETLNEGSVKSELVGFDIDTRMVISGFTKVDLIVDEYIDLLSSGSEEDWERTYSEFINTMKEAGSDDVIKELQMQLDEFLSERDKEINE